MKILAVIPARYASSRFEGKPLADICGKPMIWWVYARVASINAFSDLVVATDSERIYDVCRELNLNAVMTSENHVTSTQRVFEVATAKKADAYVVINGDEPLIEPKTLQDIIPSAADLEEHFFVSNLITKITQPSEVIDPSNIKVVRDRAGFCQFMSRSPIPFPQSSIRFDYMKHVGVLAYNYNALEFFNSAEMGPLENIEKINELRFLENGVRIKLIETNSDTLSVDTPKDLEKIISIVKEKNLIPG